MCLAMTQRKEDRNGGVGGAEALGFCFSFLSF